MHTGFWCGDLETLGRPRHRLVDNIKIDSQVMGWGDMDWIDMALDRNTCGALLNSVMKWRVL